VVRAGPAPQPVPIPPQRRLGTAAGSVVRGWGRESIIKDPFQATMLKVSGQFLS